MKRITPILLLTTIINCYSQNNSETQHVILNIGANRLASAFILRNNMDNTISKGWGINFTVSKPSSPLRVSTQYSGYKTLDMNPTWKSVSANKVELNLEIVTHFDNLEMLLYPFLGPSYNYISGIYTGKSDPDGLDRFYVLNSRVTKRWIGLTAGLGLERSIKRFTIFTNYRMHIVKAEEAIRIMDIGLDAGLKYRIDLKFKKRKKNVSDTSDNNTPVNSGKIKYYKKSIFKRLKMPNNRYDLD